MHTFNLAMLSRQGWRILQNPSSPCARILKAHYFPNSTALEAVEHDGISYSWSSILQGLNVVKQGYIWRVGAGTRINIWTDPWIPSSPNRMVITHRDQIVLSVMADLIDPNTGLWDEDLINVIFDPVDARSIMQIPLSLHAFDDFIAWHPKRNGIFTVRSAYKVQWERSFRAHANRTERPAGSHNPEIWSKLRKLKIPRKVHFFVWMILHGIIPLKSTLTNRHIGNDGACSICHQGLRMFGTYYLSVHKPGSCEIGS